jgi:hypothetical protein
MHSLESEKSLLDDFLKPLLQGSPPQFFITQNPLYKYLQGRKKEKLW